MGISIKPIRGWKGNMGLKAGWIGLRLVPRVDHRQLAGLMHERKMGQSASQSIRIDCG
jgi:hypothetical protein